MLEYELTGYEYIELNKLLKMMRVVGSGGEANVHIENEEVLVNDRVETQKRKKLRIGDQVTFANTVIVIK